MDEMIQELIQMDQKARETVRQTERQRDQMRDEIAQQKDQVQASYLNRAQNRIEKVRQHEESESVEQIQAIEKEFRRAQEELERKFRENKDRWVNEIVRHCLSPEASD